jgi:drug/metabolite transporter (DMT)-like permease
MRRTPGASLSPRTRASRSGKSAIFPPIFAAALMPYLLFVTVLWAFSFSLIGEYLAGHVDSYFAVLTRVLLAGLVFLPLTRWRGVAPRSSAA